MGRSTGKPQVKRKDDSMAVLVIGTVADWMRVGEGKEKNQRCFLGYGLCTKVVREMKEDQVV